MRAMLITGLLILLVMVLAGCGHTDESKPTTVVQLVEPVTVQPQHPIPAACKSATAPTWPQFRKPTEEGAPLEVFLQDVQRAKKRHYQSLGRIQACECVVIHQWGSDEDKRKAPAYCRRIVGEA